MGAAADSKRTTGQDQLDLWPARPRIQEHGPRPRPPVEIRDLPEVERLQLVAEPSRCLTPAQAAQHLGIGRTTVYRLMTDGELTSIRIGRSRRIPLASIGAYVSRQLGSADQPT